MTIENKIAPHETFELHELLTFKSVSATKSEAMSGLVKDEELKAILREDFTESQKQIKELQSLLQLSVFAPYETTQASAEITNATSH